jgi:HSP20 family protein
MEPLSTRNNDELARESGWRSPVLSLRREVDRVFDWFVQPHWERGESPVGPSATWLPLVDIAESDGGIVVRIEVPGMSKDDVDVAVSGSVLEITGEKKQLVDEKKDDQSHCERRFGRFKRSIELPDTADLDQVEAEQENGLLTVRIPKKAESISRRIEVKSTSVGARKTKVKTSA